MGLICKLFGHTPEPGYYGDSGNGDCHGYLQVELDALDGMGRQHARVYATCRRCGKRYQAGMIHVPRMKEDGTWPRTATL